jgi:hypothetical protein
MFCKRFSNIFSINVNTTLTLRHVSSRKPKYTRSANFPIPEEKLGVIHYHMLMVKSMKR